MLGHGGHQAGVVQRLKDLPFPRSPIMHEEPWAERKRRQVETVDPSGFSVWFGRFGVGEWFGEF